MAGLVPAIHVFLCSQGVDARHKAGHDEIEVAITTRTVLESSQTFANARFFAFCSARHRFRLFVIAITPRWPQASY
jgi:hypothetical protein